MSRAAKIWLIAASILVLIGCIIFGGIMTMLKWDFTKLSTVKYETNNYEIAGGFKNISIKANTADILFVASESQDCTIICYEQEKVRHTVAVEDNTLAIEAKDSRRWYEYIGINFDTPQITVYIPQGEYDALSVKSSTGDIRVENMAIETLKLSVTTGSITVSDITCQEDINISVSTGKAKLSDVVCKNVVSSGNTGDIFLQNVIASEKISIKRSTGNVRLEHADAAEIFVKTDTGNVTGTLLSDKVFITKTDTGRINVPKTTSGGRCEINTDTGDIKIKIQ